jgi:hypothetical protein
MNISDSPTRVELFNERSRLVTKNAKQEDTPTLTLVDEKERTEAEYHRRPDPLIQALMDKLPKPNTTWSLEERAKWLRAAAIIFNLVYSADAAVAKPEETAPETRNPPSAA